MWLQYSYIQHTFTESITNELLVSINKQPVNVQNSFSVVSLLSHGQTQNICLHFNTVLWAKLRFSWHCASSVCACVCSTSQKTRTILQWGGLHLQLQGEITHNLYLYQRAVRSAVSAVMQHCMNTNRYNTQHTSAVGAVMQHCTNTNRYNTQHTSSVSDVRQHCMNTNRYNPQHTSSVSAVMQHCMNTNRYNTQHTSAVSAVRQHCMNTNRYNTQHTSYTPFVSLKRTANNKLHAAQCCWRSQQLHSQAANMEQEGSLPCAQQPTCPYLQ